MNSKKIPFKVLINSALAYARKDKTKLKVMYEYLTRLIEVKLEKEAQIESEVPPPLTESNQKKIELKLDEKIMDFVTLAERLGKSTSGLICELIAKRFGVSYSIATRKPKDKKYGKTISLKVPKELYRYVLTQSGNSKPFHKIVREVVEDFLKSVNGGGNVQNEIRI